DLHRRPAQPRETLGQPHGVRRGHQRAAEVRRLAPRHALEPLRRGARREAARGHAQAGEAAAAGLGDGIGGWGFWFFQGCCLGPAGASALTRKRSTGAPSAISLRRAGWTAQGPNDGRIAGWVSRPWPVT